MSKASNLAYLKAITDRLEALPLAVAKRAGFHALITLVSEHTRIDSGQAAANWKFEWYAGSPSYAPQKMMWGYGDVSPTSPVGFKSYYSGYIPVNNNLPRGETGNPETILSWQMEQAAFTLMSVPKEASGVTVYNPITPGYADFAPGDDTYYEENALGEAKARIQAVGLASIARAWVEIKAEFKAGRGFNANS